MKFVVIALSLMMASTAMARECVLKNRIRGHEVTSLTSITLDLAGNEKYHMTISPCLQLDSPLTVMGFETFSSFNVCEGDNVLVYDEMSWNVLERCPIRSIEKVQP
jgi:hypothetical protein